MIISEKQIIRLIELAKLYSREIKLSDPDLSIPLDNFLNEIFNQQSEELKVVSDEG